MEVARHKPKIVLASWELQSIARRRLRNDVAFDSRVSEVGAD